MALPPSFDELIAADHPAHNILIAFNKYHKKIWAFLSEPDIPFDNNMAERDLRMIKAKQKVYGGFRSMEGGHGFAMIRGLIARARKQDLNMIEQFIKIFNLEQKHLNLGAE